MGWPIVMERKGCESIEIRTQFVLWLRPLIPPMTLTLDFTGQILKKKLYLKNGRVDGHRTKRTWVHRMLTPPCDIELWPWPWIFKVKLKKAVLGWPFDMERKGCESIGTRTHFVTLNFDLSRDLDHGFSRSNLKKAISQECESRLTWSERDVSR